MEYMTIEEEPNDGSKFLAIIRNPYDRLVSCWENKKEYFPADTFEQFIDCCATTPDGVINAHAQSQVAFIDREVDQYINFDYLVKEMHNIGIEVKEFKNKTKRLPWVEYFNLQTAQKVQDRYLKDLELYESLLLNVRQWLQM